MIRLNAEAERTKNYAKAADLYFNVGAALAQRPSGHSGPSHIGESFPQKLARWTLRHLELAGFSLLLSVIFGIPLGIAASRGGATGCILGFAGIVQTIPSLALLALRALFPFFGSSLRTAIAALFLTVCCRSCTNTASGYRTSLDADPPCVGRATTRLTNLSPDGVALFYPESKRAP